MLEKKMSLIIKALRDYQTERIKFEPPPEPFDYLLKKLEEGES